MREMVIMKNNCRLIAKAGPVEIHCRCRACTSYISRSEPTGSLATNPRRYRSARLGNFILGSRSVHNLFQQLTNCPYVIGQAVGHSWRPPFQAAMLLAV